MSIHKTRGLLYRLAKLLGDISAVSSGKARQDSKENNQESNWESHGEIIKNAIQIIPGV